MPGSTGLPNKLYQHVCTIELYKALSPQHTGGCSFKNPLCLLADVRFSLLWSHHSGSCLFFFFSFYKADHCSEDKSLHFLRVGGNRAGVTAPVLTAVQNGIIHIGH